LGVEVLSEPVDGWIRLEPQSAIAGLNPPSEIWIEAPGDPQALIEHGLGTEGFGGSFVAYDSPHGEIIGVHFPGEGFVPVSHLGQFTPGAGLLNEFPCLDNSPNGASAVDCISSVLREGHK